MTARRYPIDKEWRVLIKDLGLQPADVLRRASLSDDLLSRPMAHLQPEEFYRFWESVESEHGDPHFAIRFHETLRTESFSPPIFAALCSPNLLVAAQRIGQYKALVAPMRVEVHEEGETVVVTPVWLRTTRQPPISLVLADLLFVVRLARVGTRERITPVGVLAEELPASVDAYTKTFGVHLEEGTGNHVIFTREDALRPFLTADEALWDTFEPELRRRLAQLEEVASTRERTKAALLEALPSGVVGMEAVARKLAMSKRTLQRRLGAEDCTFQLVLDSVRQELADHYLRRTSLASPEISFLLGFRETTSFYRAFSRWTGQTPEAVRGLSSPRRPSRFSAA